MILLVFSNVFCNHNKPIKEVSVKMKEGGEGQAAF